MVKKQKLLKSRNLKLKKLTKNSNINLMITNNNSIKLKKGTKNKQKVNKLRLIKDYRSKEQITKPSKSKIKYQLNKNN